MNLLLHGPFEDQPEDLPVCAQGALFFGPTLLSAILANFLVQETIEKAIETADGDILEALRMIGTLRLIVCFQRFSTQDTTKPRGTSR
jgi:hypothetical protein